jgi:hydroxysqualene synthase
MRPDDAHGADLHEAYRYCLGIARWHYENFPVASHALPADLRGPVAAIYAFARTADDFADEGDDPPETRLARLDDYRDRLTLLAHGDTPRDPIFIALADVLRRFALPIEPLHDLLDAFAQDVTKTRYADFSEVLAYCRRSANPIGRMILHLFHAADDANIACSDQLCSAFQLTNFLQDLEQDYRKSGRIYLPRDEMALHGVTEAHFRERRTDDAMRTLVAQQVARIRRMLAEGSPLAWRLPGRTGLEARMILFGVTRIADKIAAEPRDVFRRLRLGKRDWLWIALRAATSRGF